MSTPQGYGQVVRTGLPQVREAAWLYQAGTDIPAAWVKLEERLDGGWDLYLYDPAGTSAQRARYPVEADARAALAGIYAQGERQGVWTVRRYPQ